MSEGRSLNLKLKARRGPKSDEMTRKVLRLKISEMG